MAKYLNLAGLQTLWTKLKDTFALKKHSHTAEDIPVDSTLSSTSENPVQNKVVNTALAGKSATSHTHGLSNSTLYGTCTNSTDDDGWKMLDSNIDGKTSNYAALRAIRFNANAPAWAVGRYGAGIFFGGSDTKGLISLTYPSNSINVKFAGGSGSKPAWWFGLSGSSGKNYTLENMRERYSLEYHRTSANGSSYDGKQWTKIAWRFAENYQTAQSYSEASAVLNFYQNAYGGVHYSNIGRLTLQAYWGHAAVPEGGTPYSFKTSGTKNAFWNNYVPSIAYVGDYTTYNSGRLHVKVVCTDDTIEWWVANCIWDTALQFDVLYKSNIGLSGNGTGSVIMTNDEFNEYCEDKLVRDVTLGDGTTASSAVKATQDASGNVITDTYAPKSHNHSADNITSGTLPIARGGTGATTAKAAEYNLLKPTVSTDAIGDDSEVAFKYVTPTNTNGVVYARKASLLWNYIKSKLSGNDVDIGGNAATASAAKAGSDLETAINGKANAASVTGATKCKVTYNNQGVITAGADLAASDIPNLAASKITSGTFADDRIASASKWNAKQDDISDMIPTAASASNPLCDKAYADAIGERLEARYLGCNANGDPFATHAALTSATKFYYQGAETTPDTNDITTVIADEDHKNTSNVAGTTRYRYGGVDASGKPVWAFEYVINNTGLSEAQLLAVNSGITATKVTKYEGYATGKQDKLAEGSNITISENTISATDTTYSEASKTDVEKIVTDLS